MLGDERLEVDSELLATSLPEHMREAMHRDGVKALVPKIRDERMLRRGITLKGSTDVGAHLRQYLTVGRDGLAEDAEDDRQILPGRRNTFG
jgi:hypothetical protein